MKAIQRMKVLAVLSTLIAFCSEGRGAEQADYAAIVEDLTPSVLTTRPPDEAGKIRSAFVTARFENDDAVFPSIVAVYTDSNEAVVTLIEHGGEKWQVKEDWTISEVATFPAIELRDLDSDEIPEVIVQIGVGPRSEEMHFVFRWAGNTLAFVPQEDLNIGPGDDPGSDLSIAEYVDVDGDGRTEIICAYLVRTEEEDTEYPFKSRYAMYTYSREKLTSLRLLTAFESVPVPKKRDTISTFEFSADELGQTYLLRMVRTGGKGNWLAGGAEVRLNGKRIATAKDFRKDRLVVPVTLQAKNRIEIRVPDAPHGEGVPPSHPDADAVLHVIVEPELGHDS